MFYTQFKAFFNRHLFDDMERCIELFSIFGSLDVTLDESTSYHLLIERHIFDSIGAIYNHLEDMLLDETRYARLLHALAIGDRKITSAFKKARLSEKEGGEYINTLVKAGLIRIEHSREIDPKELYDHPLKRELARHRIVHKIRFNDPFVRFFYAFVSPHLDEITKGEYTPFFKRFNARFNSYIGFTFENLSLMYMQKRLYPPIVENGSYWDKDVEIDILALDEAGSIIVGECKWTNAKINKKELHKLDEKCLHLHLVYNKMILFSKRGYSKEMTKLASDKLILVEAKDFEALVTL